MSDSLDSIDNLSCPQFNMILELIGDLQQYKQQQPGKATRRNFLITPFYADKQYILHFNNAAIVTNQINLLQLYHRKNCIMISHAWLVNGQG